MSVREKVYCKNYFKGVQHTTLNPYGPGVVRIHMIPPKFSLFKNNPSIIVLNGQDIIPINTSWAILLSSFITEANFFDGREVSDSELQDIVRRTIASVHKVYPKTKDEQFKTDLWIIIETLKDIAYGKEPKEEVGYMSIGEYAPFMRAPHRMDLMISSMTKDGCWHCNQKCLHCYAAGQQQAQVDELSTNEWKTIIDKCREACIPQLTFTGGEPTLRADLTELIDYAKWFVTRLNTNGVLLTDELCKNLYDASLDSVQITLYSSNREEHNQLVGAPNFDKTVEGIKNAINAGINVSVNTPICSINRNYTETLRFLKEIGVEYVSCSGLIVTGNARNESSTSTQLSSYELFECLKDAADYCKENQIEISFTSPGWIPEEKIRALGLTVPSCGACLSNMAVAPDGSVVPCQSWLDGKSNLGNMLNDSWKKIWNNPDCAKRRKFSALMDSKCPLREMGDAK